MSDVRVSLFDERYLPAFVALNEEWIQTYFEIEDMDRKQLRDPFSAILNVGGEIFFILENEIPVGTCAMVPHGPHGYELAKMAVRPDTRGKGYGDLLMSSALHWALDKDAREVLILSNTILEPAIRLYKKHGFQTVHLGEHPDYKRCNIEMILKLGQPL
jgi:GNAT superfamily N-acetyltransferase